MSFIQLDRRFVSWSKDTADPDLFRHMDGIRGSIDWNELKLRSRIVILAEAGSGKTKELEAQHNAVLKEGLYSFHATVQKIADKGLAAALGSSAITKIDEWLSSDQSAWFFIDSVDEAKAKELHFEDALRELADAIKGSEGRAHIIISGRHSNWEFQHDLSLIEKILPIPLKENDLEPADANQALIKILRTKESDEKKELVAETPSVLIMVALDKKRVELFAKGKNVDDSERFIDNINRSNLWDLARRPLDLDWLVEYWQENKKFGSLSEMLEQSIKQRLKETNSNLQTRDSLTSERAMEGAERIGAILTLRRIDTVLIPDYGKSLGGSTGALKLDDALPDWSSAERKLLITRPIFDPASAGLARLHNDNQGTVRSYLAAQWIIRLSANNCPIKSIHNLLFARQYGVELVKPSMRQTAAWVALKNRSIARELIRIDPSVLIGFGDPSSLPVDERKIILKEVISKIANEESYNSPDYDSLKRFAQKDMASFIQEQWKEVNKSEAARELLLLMIELGEITECSNVASEAAYGQFKDRYTQLYASRALLATADAAEKIRYSQYIVKNVETLPSRVVWNAIEGLFPKYLSVSELVKILVIVDLDNDGGFGFDHYGPELIKKINTAKEVEEVLSALLKLRGSVDEIDFDETDREMQKTLGETIEAAGLRLLSLSPGSQPPSIAIDAAIMNGISERYERGSRKDDPENLANALLKTPNTRQAVVWRASKILSGSKALSSQPMSNIWQLGFAGLFIQFDSSDLGWVLLDARSKTNTCDRSLASSIAMTIWRDNDKSNDLLLQIKQAAAFSTELAETLAEWLKPRTESPEEREFKIRKRKRDKKNALQEAKDNASWIKFADGLRSDPDQIRKLSTPKKNGVDSRLWNIWRLLGGFGRNQTRYADPTLSTLVPILGAEVVALTRSALMQYWRLCSATLRSERPLEERNNVYAIESIAIMGITIEAAEDSNWAIKLTDEEAEKAAIFATLQLNGFPDWLPALSVAKPVIVSNVLTRYIAVNIKVNIDEAISDEKPLPYLSDIQTLSNADEKIIKIVAGDIFQVVLEKPDMELNLLEPIARLLTRGFESSNQLLEFAISRFVKDTRTAAKAIYLGMAYTLNADRATKELVDLLTEMDAPAKTGLAIAVLPRIFGNGWEKPDISAHSLSIKNLTLLIELAYSAVRVEQDIHRPNGKAYSPGARDHAERARWAAFTTLADKPGFATIEALRYLTLLTWFPIPRQRVIETAMKRAGIDAESEPWTAEDTVQYEKDFLTAPRTSKDLQAVVGSHIKDIEHDLLNGSTNQGKVVARLPKEEDVQNWVKEALNKHQKRGYSVERETHVAEEKEPDLMITAKSTDARLPIEIKVAETWSLTQLENALTKQLMDQYIRDRLDRWGVLLLVYQRKKPKGWWNGKKFLSFEDVVKHLEAMALEISARDFDSPQLHISVIDVSKVKLG